MPELEEITITIIMKSRKYVGSIYMY
jgi:hypothetical protein